jgi:hypothetical protein
MMARALSPSARATTIDDLKGRLPLVLSGPRVNATNLPSGDQRGPDTTTREGTRGAMVSSPEPSALAATIAESRTNAIRVPSGDQAGIAAPVATDTARGSLPSALATKTPPNPVRGKATKASFAPSGE